MRFRPCIDIHNGRVKQIVGGSLSDAGDQATSNFISDRGAAYYAHLYRQDGLCGGHVIMLNAGDSPFFEADRTQALEALHAYPGGLQIGGGICADNAKEYLLEGASHVIVTSYIFQGETICLDRLKNLVKAVGREHIVLDLSGRKQGNSYYVVTDRWQTFTSLELTPQTLKSLEMYCAEFLVHGVDAEGKQSGMEQELVRMLAEYADSEMANPVTYAGGIRTMDDIQLLRVLGEEKLDYTVGSALDLFGGELEYGNVKFL